MSLQSSSSLCSELLVCDCVASFFSPLGMALREMGQSSVGQALLIVALHTVEREAFALET